MTRDYELGFILHPEVNEERTRAILERVEQIATNYGGQIMRVNQWGRRRLAYPIQHNRDGFYVFVDMVLTPETVSELDRTLKVSEDVLRHLIKLRDPKTVQKEREAQTSAAAQATAEPDGEVPASTGPESGEASAEEQPEGTADTDTDDVSEVALSPDEDEAVPPAVEEETIEA